jgi:hypothetical protein
VPLLAGVQHVGRIWEYVELAWQNKRDGEHVVGTSEHKLGECDELIESQKM